MTTNESWRRYLEAGAAVGQLTLARAEEIARGLLAPGEEERSNAWREFEDLTRFGRLMGEQLVEVARAEVTKQLQMFGVGSLDQLWERISDLVGSAPVDEPYEAATTRTGDVPEGLVYRPSEPGGAIGDPRDPDGPTTAVEHPKAKQDEKDAKRAKAKNQKKGKKGAKGKKNKAVHDKEKDGDGAGPHWSSGSNRVLSLAKPPDSAGSV